MPRRDISALLERVELGSTAAPEKLTAEMFEERELIKTQILSLGFDLDEDDAFQRWSIAELRELLEALVDVEYGVAEEEEEDDVVVVEAPSVTFATQIPGINDVMSGALRPRRASHTSQPASGCVFEEEFDDPTVSVDTLPRLYRSMPHYMMSVDVLKSLNLFTSAAMYDMLPANFFTTVKGLKRAWDEANVAQPNPADDMDLCLLEAVLKRGGLVKNFYWSVKYPCDIVPQHGEQGDPGFWVEIRGMT